MKSAPSKTFRLFFILGFLILLFLEKPSEASAEVGNQCSIVGEIYRNEYGVNNIYESIGVWQGGIGFLTTNHLNTNISGQCGNRSDLCVGWDVKNSCTTPPSGFVWHNSTSPNYTFNGFSNVVMPSSGNTMCLIAWIREKVGGTCEGQPSTYATKSYPLWPTDHSISSFSYNVNVNTSSGGWNIDYSGTVGGNVFAGEQWELRKDGVGAGFCGALAGQGVTNNPLTSSLSFGCSKYVPPPPTDNINNYTGNICFVVAESRNSSNCPYVPPPTPTPTPTPTPVPAISCAASFNPTTGTVTQGNYFNLQGKIDSASGGDGSGYDFRWVATWKPNLGFIYPPTVDPTAIGTWYNGRWNSTGVSAGNVKILFEAKNKNRTWDNRVECGGQSIVTVVVPTPTPAPTPYCEYGVGKGIYATPNPVVEEGTSKVDVTLANISNCTNGSVTGWDVPTCGNYNPNPGIGTTAYFLADSSAPAGSFCDVTANVSCTQGNTSCIAPIEVVGLTTPTPTPTATPVSTPGPTSSFVPLGYFQSKGGDIHSEGTIVSDISNTYSVDPKYVSLVLETYPGIISYGAETVNFGSGGSAGSPGWLVGGGYNISDICGGGCYKYFLNATDSDTLAAGTINDLSGITDGKSYTVDGDLTMGSLTSDVLDFSGRTNQFLVDGNVNINGQIKGGFMVVASGNIYINKDLWQGDNSNDAPVVEGVYVADGMIVTSHDAPSTRRFSGKGIFVGNGGVVMNRDLSDADNVLYPDEYFIYDPSLLMKFRGLVGRAQRFWVEVAP